MPRTAVRSRFLIMSSSDPIHGEGDFTCWNCRKPFPNMLSTVVRQQDVKASGELEERTFHSPECADEWEQRGGEPRPN
jgi:hypothetical protein